MEEEEEEEREEVKEEDTSDAANSPGRQQPVGSGWQRPDLILRAWMT